MYRTVGRLDTNIAYNFIQLYELGLPKQKHYFILYLMKVFFRVDIIVTLTLGYRLLKDSS